MKRREIQAIVLTAIVLITVAVFFVRKEGWFENFYKAEPTPIVTPTASPINEIFDWNLYKSEKDDFEIKYPPELITSEVEYDSSASGFQYKNSSSQFPVITIKKIEIKNGEAFESVLFKNTVFDGSGLSPDSIKDFEIRNFGENQFYYIKSGLFEGVLSAEYYFIQPKFVFQIYLRADGIDWTNPEFDPEEEATHKILKKMLPTFKSLGSVGETMQVRVYFCGNEDVAKDCKCTNAVVRTIPKTSAVARAAIEELINGLTQEEKDKGLSSVIVTQSIVKEYKEKSPKIFQDGDPLNITGDKVEINSLKIESGTAYIDFSKEVLIYGTITASCGGSAFISSVENTLKQFSSIKKVKISIDGEAYPENFF